jgi:hypothetical protein
LTHIHAQLEKINQVVGEDANTEYLFLVGDEATEYTLSWYTLKFKSGDDIRAGLRWAAGL